MKPGAATANGRNAAAQTAAADLAAPMAAPAPGSHPFFYCDAAAAARQAALSEAARQRAWLFDGLRSPAVRLVAARASLGVIESEATLSDAAMDLSLCGLLQPGRREPLPAPRQLEQDPWKQPAHRGFGRVVGMSSLLPGSLAGPGLPGAIGGVDNLVLRGGATRLQWALRPGRPWTAIGKVVAAPALHPRLGLGVVVLAVIGLIGFWNHRLEVARNVLPLLVWHRAVLVVLISALLINLARQCARLSAIRATTHLWPRFGLTLQFKVLPSLFTDTAGPAENADASARGRILLSAPLATLSLTVAAMFGWFLTRGGGAAHLPAFFIGLTTLSLIGFLSTINPLARRDGYYWLAHRLHIPDLREQAFLALSGKSRAWNVRALPSKNVRLFYAGLVVAYLAGVLVLYLMFPARWLTQAHGGSGAVFFLSVVGFNLYQQSRRGWFRRGSTEPFRVKLPKITRTHKIIAAVAAGLFLLPYPYEPSGKAVVLPHNRAEVRALVAGDVREVLVKEGDTVEAGQELLRLADAQPRAQAAAAEATLKRAQSELAIVKTGGASGEVQLAREKLATAQKRLQYAQAESDRLTDAYKRRAVSPQDYDQARGQADVRRQEAMEAQQQLKLIGNPARNEKIDALESEVVRAQTDLAYYKEQLGNTSVRAPIAGRVASNQLLFARGKYMKVGDEIALIEDTSQLQAEVQMPESSVGEIKPDAAAWLRVWAFPGGSFEGRVVHVAPDAQDGEYGKVVRVRMKIDDPDHQLKPEMTGQAKVRSHWTIAGFAFTHALMRFFFVEVWSWLP